MKRRWSGLAAIGFGVTLLADGAMSASAFDATTQVQSGHGSMWSSFQSRASDVIDDFDPFDQRVPSGTIDDGKDLLPQATITLSEAIAVAQTTGTGALGEVDLEYFNDRLVFNIDIGNTDVKVDAANGIVLASIVDE